MKKRTVLFIVLILLGVIAFSGYQYLYKEHRNIATETSVMETSAEALLTLFQEGDATEYLNKTLTVSGVITQIEGKAITLNEVVQATFDSLPETLSLQQNINLKGRCVGYDELFEIVKIDQCAILPTK